MKMDSLGQPPEEFYQTSQLNQEQNGLIFFKNGSLGRKNSAFCLRIPKFIKIYVHFAYPKLKPLVKKNKTALPRLHKLPLTSGYCPCLPLKLFFNVASWAISFVSFLNNKNSNFQGWAVHFLGELESDILGILS